MATKKVGLTGKYGTRYGSVIREKINAVTSQKKFSCPSCLKVTLVRQQAGIWVCSSCGYKQAGKAYKP